MIPVMDHRRDVLASLSLILAAAGLGCAQTELGNKQLYRMVVIFSGSLGFAFRAGCRCTFCSADPDFFACHFFSRCSNSGMM
jgi:hypothetical protein